MSMIENLELIKDEGLNKFIEKQYLKYKCKKCNELISVHNKKCFVCEKIDSGKN
jgi:Zn finger protein HypA/HybF involved in hydrogenase expression